MAAVTYDRANRELRTVRFHFADKREAVVKISWERDVKRGAQITVGQHLATIEWRKSDPEVIRAPAACTGTIERKTRVFQYDKFRRHSVLLLALRR